MNNAILNDTREMRDELTPEQMDQVSGGSGANLWGILLNLLETNRALGIKDRARKAQDSGRGTGPYD